MLCPLQPGYVHLSNVSGFRSVQDGLQYYQFQEYQSELLFQTILVHTDNCLLTTVDTSLCTCSSFFDTHLWNTCFDSFRHTTQFFNFLNMLPSLVCQFVRQRFYIVRTTPWVNVLADVSFFPECKSVYYGQYVRKNLLEEQ